MGFLANHSELIELLIAILLALTVDVLYYYVLLAYLYSTIAIAQEVWSQRHFGGRPDISDEALDDVYKYFYLLATLLLIVSYLVSPFSIYFSAANDKISLPIRLLLVAENVCRFIYSIGTLIECNPCDIIYYWLPNIKCSKKLYSTFVEIGDILVNRYSFYDMAIFCQLTTSISRFLAISFEGRFFRYTKEWPLTQVIFPFIISVAFSQLDVLKNNPPEIDSEEIPTIWYLILMFILDNFFVLKFFLQFFPFFLDLTIYRKMSKLKLKGKTTLAERMLMLQMIINGLISLGNTWLRQTLRIIAYVFLGPNCEYLAYPGEKTFLIVSFCLGTNLTNAIFLRKRIEKSKKGERLTITSIEMQVSNGKRTSSVATNHR